MKLCRHIFFLCISIISCLVSFVSCSGSLKKAPKSFKDLSDSSVHIIGQYLNVPQALAVDKRMNFLFNETFPFRLFVVERSGFPELLKVEGDEGDLKSLNEVISTKDPIYVFQFLCHGIVHQKMFKNNYEPLLNLIFRLYDEFSPEQKEIAYADPNLSTFSDIDVAVQIEHLRALTFGPLTHFLSNPSLFVELLLNNTNLFNQIQSFPEFGEMWNFCCNHFQDHDQYNQISFVAKSVFYNVPVEIYGNFMEQNPKICFKVCMFIISVHDLPVSEYESSYQKIIELLNVFYLPRIDPQSAEYEKIDFYLLVNEIRFKPDHAEMYENELRTRQLSADDFNLLFDIAIIAKKPILLSQLFNDERIHRGTILLDKLIWKIPMFNIDIPSFPFFKVFFDEILLAWNEDKELEFLRYSFLKFLNRVYGAWRISVVENKFLIIFKASDEMVQFGFPEHFEFEDTKFTHEVSFLNLGSNMNIINQQTFECFLLMS